MNEFEIDRIKKAQEEKESKGTAHEDKTLNETFTVNGTPLMPILERC